MVIIIIIIKKSIFPISLITIIHSLKLSLTKYHKPYNNKNKNYIILINNKDGCNHYHHVIIININFMFIFLIIILIIIIIMYPQYQKSIINIIFLISIIIIRIITIYPLPKPISPKFN